MLYCPKCKIEYDEGKKFCKECGSKLGAHIERKEPVAESQGPAQVNAIERESLSSEKVSSSERQKQCPSCGTGYPSDKKFCKTCGIPLADGATAPRPPADAMQKPVSTINPIFSPPNPPLEAASELPSRLKIRSTLRRKKRLSKHGQKFATLISNLEKQKGIISEDALNATLRPYQMQLGTIEKEIGEINDFLNVLRKRVIVETNSLEKEAIPYKNRLSELKTMRKVKGITFGDYRRLKKEPRKAARRLAGQIKKRQKMKTLLSLPSAGKFGSFDLPLYQKIAGGVVAFAILAIAGFFGYQYFFKKEGEPVAAGLKDTANVTKTQTQTPSQALPEEEIKKVFEAIKQANIKEDINLFMSCYSSTYPAFEEKKSKTIANWKDYDFTDLSFSMKDLIVNNDMAEVTVDWQITARSADTGKTDVINTANNVVLQKESGQWKITNLK